jgi:hypothetical protein
LSAHCQVLTSAEIDAAAASVFHRINALALSTIGFKNANRVIMIGTPKTLRRLSLLR